MKKKFVKLLLIGISLIFLSQAAGPLSIIPIKTIFRLLGVPENPLSLFSSGILIILTIFILYSIVDFFYSFGFKKESILISKRRILFQGVISFITIWVTFLSFFVISALKVLITSGTFETEVLLNIFLFWFFLINALVIFPEKKFNLGSSQLNKSAFIEKKRITWFSNFTDISIINEFKGETGDVVFKQTFLSNVGNALIGTIVLIFIGPMVLSRINIEFFDILIPEVSSFLNIISTFFFYSFILGLFYVIGLILSRGITLYENALKIPLPTFSDAPLFTVLLPRSTVTIKLEDIVSYKLEKRKRGRTRHEYLAIVRLNMKDGNFILIKPTTLNPNKFEKSLNSLLGNEKIMK